MPVKHSSKTQAIIATDVVKHFGNVKALNGVSMSAARGKVTALLGPNGAGKTTLINVMTTLLSADKGTVVVDGIDVIRNPAAARQHIGLAGQFAAVDDYLTGRETIEMMGQLYHLGKAESRRRAADLLDQLGLMAAANRQAKTYSGGMRRRLDLGASLVAHPPVVFLDEPTTGLDPRTRLQLWDIIRGLVDKGTTILLTTQYLDEADALADKIFVIDQGKMIAEGTAEQLKRGLGKNVIEIKVAADSLNKAAQALKKAFRKEVLADKLTRRLKIRTTADSDDLLKAAKILKTAHIKPEELSLHRPTLDDVFLSITKAGNEQ